MTNPKHPSFNRCPQHTSVAPAKASDAQAGRTGAVRPGPTDHVERMRVLDTPAALQHQRDPERLRRYILDAPDLAQQELRQQALLDTSCSTLSLWPQEPSSSSLSFASSSVRQNSRVVNMGLFAWPVLVSHACSLSVR